MAQVKRARKTFGGGDRVKWSSQAAGSRRHKVGTVVQVVKAGEVPRPATVGLKDPQAWASPRDHESYLVAVGNVLYWPRVTHLEAAREAAEEGIK